MPCEMCGKITEKLTQVKVEGTTLRVCPECSKFGQQVRRTSYRKSTYKRQESEIVIVSNYSEKIEKARQGKGIKQEDFAKQLNEKESLIHKIETGHIKPSIALAKKLGRALGIELTKELTSEDTQLNKEESTDAKNDKRKQGNRRDSGVLTIADIIKFKK